ncbi:tyrosine--tRNA ligase [Rhizobium leguminosarum]|nr:tyrosine--tRNA ligase [Rhizobium leguminosarum]
MSGLEILMENVAQDVPPDGLRQKLVEVSGRPLVVKLGVDPTAPDLHLGHAVVLRKLRDFQRAGHKIVLIIGDFTARLGDPTGRNEARPPLSEGAVDANATTYLDQLGKIISMTDVEIQRNSTWLAPLGTADIITLMSKVTVSRILSRDDFRNRLSSDVPISFHELLYPLLQGKDSLAIEADVELGGTDQLFNCMMGRTLQQADSMPGQVVLCMPLLVGLDGTEKMSKSKGNYIALRDPPNDMYAKCMSIADEVLPDYINLVCDMDRSEKVRLKEGLKAAELHPMDVKKTVAANIVTQYHDRSAAELAADAFYRNVQDRSGSQRDYMDFLVAEADERLTVTRLCQLIDPSKSKSAIRRLVEGGGISVDGRKVSDADEQLTISEDGLKIRLGKRMNYIVRKTS